MLLPFFINPDSSMENRLRHQHYFLSHFYFVEAAKHKFPSSLILCPSLVIHSDSQAATIWMWRGMIILIKAAELKSIKTPNRNLFHSVMWLHTSQCPCLAPPLKLQLFKWAVRLHGPLRVAHPWRSWTTLDPPAEVIQSKVAEVFYWGLRPSKFLERSLLKFYPFKLFLFES